MTSTTGTVPLRVLQYQAVVDAWNDHWPTGSAVVLIDDHGEAEVTRTRSEAWNLGSGDPVVLIEGRTGGYLLHRLVPVSGPVNAGHEKVREAAPALARGETSERDLDGLDREVRKGDDER